jgi:uncharacterized membrane protein YidH (DUF202 family)
MIGDIPRLKRYVGKPARSIFYSMGFIGLIIKDAVVDDALTILAQARLFIGIALVVIGLMTFSSGKFCDGGTAIGSNCTRPSTYYYFNTTSIVLVVTGTFLTVLWTVRNRKMT